MTRESLYADMEIREADGGPRLHGTILQEGRAAAGGRAELFAPGAVLWPDEGIEIRTIHKGAAEVRAVPTRARDGSITISAKATPAIVEAVRAGKTGMSVEFMALSEMRTAAGVREIERAYVGGAALTSVPEYSQTSAELRDKQPAGRVTVWL